MSNPRQESAYDAARKKPAGDPARHILTIQPEPFDADVLHIPMRNGQIASVVTKFWEPGKGERCTRCADCNLRYNVCNIGADWEVPAGEARHFWGKRYRSLDGPPSGGVADCKG